MNNKQPKQKWQDEKKLGHQNAVLDELMDMIGLQRAKELFLNIWYEIKPGQTVHNTGDELLSAVFLGGPGTGKTTVARLYARFLALLEVFGPDHEWTYKENSGSSLASKGIPAIETLINEITQAGVGALFIDDVHQLVTAHTGGGVDVLNRIIESMRNPEEKVVFIFAGYKEDMERFYGHNKTIRDRIGHTCELRGYNEGEILHMLQAQIRARINPSMKFPICQQQPQDREFLLKVVARRILRAGGVGDSGNAWAVESTVAQIKSRLMHRLGENNGWNSVDHHAFTEGDLLGPGYGENFKSDALDKLDGMIGLTEVKIALRGMIKEVLHNRMRELMDLPLLQTSLHKVFLGNPGTGKTTVAQLYGQILVELGMLSNGEVVTRTPADFISGHLGGSEAKTKEILDSTKGKVLIIDEAYGFGSKFNTNGVGGQADSYRSNIIDTLVGAIHSQPGEDRCILLLGYKDKMVEMYQDTNPGFKRRFPLETAFVFKDYSAEQLQDIWKQNLKRRGLNAGKDVEDIAMEILERQRHKLNFGNAGEVDIILDAAQRRYLERVRDDSSQFGQPVHLQPSDIDPEYQRISNACIDVEKLFEGVVGCEEVKAEVRLWPKRIIRGRERNIPSHKIFDMTFTFTGPPGTGKTSMAKNMGTILYKLGLLASNEVNVISATELIGQYLGQTGPKVRKQFEASLGKVLFIDEAYRLNSTTQYGKEAIDEITNCLTEDKFMNHLVVIFAGYEDPIIQMLNQNPGLASRVPGRLHFPPFTAKASMELLSLKLNEDGFRTTGLTDGSSSEVVEAMQSLVKLSNWANGRSIENLSRDIKRDALIEEQAGPVFYINEATVLSKMEAMRRTLIQQLPKQAYNGVYPPMPLQYQTASETMTGSEPKLQMIEKAPATSNRPKRKWSEASVDQSSTQRNKKQRQLDDAFTDLSITSSQDIRKWRHTLINKDRKLQEIAKRREEIEKFWKKMEEEKRKKEEEKKWKKEEEKKRKKEEEKKRKEEEEKRKKEKEETKRKAKEEEDKRKKAEAKLKKKMASLCVQGFAWHSIGNGWYRCAGGSHTVYNADWS